MRNWFITGISSGIGEALARAALHAGDSVVGTARDADALRAFAALAPDRAHALQLDVTDTAAVVATVERAIAATGSLDVVVSNAGRSLFGALEETALSEVRALCEVNVLAPWAVAQAVLPHFRARGGGRLVHMSSGCGLTGVAGLSAYSASKFALEGFSEALGQEVAGFGISVMLVEPGAVATRFISHSTGEAARRLPDYGFISGQGKSALDVYYATSACSPARIAEAILGALAQPAMPLRLLVGEDARAATRMKCEAMLALANAAS
jgi:NAD(P)-dependent dehydrogenase (short-subunit alcohol dehydrogenase family)